MYRHVDIQFFIIPYCLLNPESYVSPLDSRSTIIRQFLSREILSIVYDYLCASQYQYGSPVFETFEMQAALLNYPVLDILLSRILSIFLLPSH